MRRRGLGSLLVRQLQNVAFEIPGTREVTLNVYRDNLGALSLYEALGFVPVESKSRADALFMTSGPSTT